MKRYLLAASILLLFSSYSLSTEKETRLHDTKIYDKNGKLVYPIKKQNEIRDK